LPRITLLTTTTRNGVSREITVHTLRVVADWARELPVLLVNNSPQIETARQFFPRLIERQPPHEIAAPYAENRLIIGGFAKTTLERSASKRAEVNRFLRLETIGQDETSVVTFKSVKQEIAAGVPGIIARHHGQNAGDDELRDVSVHTVTDGVRPKTGDLNKQVRAKTGRSPSQDRPVQSTGCVLMTDGSGRAVPVLAYADPDMQAEYKAIHGGSITQAGARDRSVMRTAANPVRTNYLGRIAPDSVVFTSVHLWRDVRPGRLGEMVLRGCVYLNAATMAAMYPDLFATEKAASNARERFGDVWARVRAWVGRDRVPWARVRWQRAGQGCGLQWLLCREAEVEARKAVLAASGKIVHWQVERFTDGQPPSREDIPGTVKEYRAEPGRTSDASAPAAEAPLPWSPAGTPESAYWMERPPDG
jgi:hypothetical protein